MFKFGKGRIMLKINKDKIKGLIVGVIGMSIIGMSVLSFADMQSIQAFFNDIKIQINGKTVETGNDKPFIYNGRTMIPARFIAEGLGATVKWNESNNTVEIESGKVEVVVKPTPNVIPSQTPRPTATPTPIVNYKYNLTDTQVQEAIDEGKKGLSNLNKLGNDKYSIPLNLNETSQFFKYDNASAIVQTPFYNITSHSYLQAEKFEDTTVDSVRWLLNGAIKENELRINATFLGTSIDFHTGMSFAILQDGKFTKPVNSNIPKFATYITYNDNWHYSISPMMAFKLSNLDENKPCKLVVNWQGEKIVFDIDLNKYK